MADKKPDKTTNYTIDALHLLTGDTEAEHTWCETGITYHNPKTGYQGTLWCKPAAENGEAAEFIVLHEGTLLAEPDKPEKISRTILTDNTSLLNDSRLREDAIQFTDNVLSYLNDLSDTEYRLTQAGHCLGGALAVYAGDYMINERHHPIDSILSIDGSGMAQNLKKLGRTGEEINAVAEKTTECLVFPGNVINACGKHFDLRNALFLHTGNASVPYTANAKKDPFLGYVEHSMKQHRPDAILEMLETGNPLTYTELQKALQSREEQKTTMRLTHPSIDPLDSYLEYLHRVNAETTSPKIASEIRHIGQSRMLAETHRGYTQSFVNAVQAEIGDTTKLNQRYTTIAGLFAGSDGSVIANMDGNPLTKISTAVSNLLSLKDHSLQIEKIF